MRTHRELLSPNVVDNVDRAMAYGLEDVAEAHLQQSRIAKSWLNLFEEIDVVICPAASSTPFPHDQCCLLYTSPSPRDGLLSRMPSSA